MMRSLKELNFNVEQKANINFIFLFEAIDVDIEHVHMLCF